MTLSVKNKDEDNAEPNVWPNPGRNELGIVLPSSVSCKVSVPVRSVTGQILRSITIMVGRKSAVMTELDPLAEGIYNIWVMDATGTGWMMK